MYVYIQIRYCDHSIQIFPEINAPCVSSHSLELKSHLPVSSAPFPLQDLIVTVINKGCPSASIGVHS